MQELSKILEEIDETIERYKENPRLESVDICYGLNQAKRIIRKHAEHERLMKIGEALLEGIDDSEREMEEILNEEN